MKNSGKITREFQVKVPKFSCAYLWGSSCNSQLLSAIFRKSLSPESFREIDLISQFIFRKIINRDQHISLEWMKSTHQLVAKNIATSGLIVCNEIIKTTFPLFFGKLSVVLQLFLPRGGPVCNVLPGNSKKHSFVTKRIFLLSSFCFPVHFHKKYHYCFSFHRTSTTNDFKSWILERWNVCKSVISTWIVLSTFTQSPLRHWTAHRKHWKTEDMMRKIVLDEILWNLKKSGERFKHFSKKQKKKNIFFQKLVTRLAQKYNFGT